MIQIDPEKLEREILAMREMIATDPEVLAHFDVNGDGVIDGAEWQAVVRLVTLRLQREAEDAARAQAVMDRDAGGAPTTEEIAREPTPQPTPEPRQSGELASHLYQDEVRPYVSAVQSESPDSEIASMFELPRVVLEQSEKEFTGEHWMGYLVRDHRGVTVGRIGLRHSTGEELHYDVWDAKTGSTLSLRQERRGRHQPLLAFDEAGQRLGFALWKSSLLGRSKITFESEGRAGRATQQFFDEHVFDVCDSRDQAVGRIEHDWFGLGFLTGSGRQLHVQANGAISRAGWMVMFATAIAADWCCERERMTDTSDMLGGLLDLLD